jgi:peptide/nickel transport system permease protein
VLAITIRQFLRSKAGIVGFGILFVVLVLAAFAAFIAPYSPVEQNFTQQLRGPSSHHFMGTDRYGRDIFSRIVYGTRYALLSGLLADGVALGIGCLLGLIGAFYGGWWDFTIMRGVDVMMAFPYLLLAMLTIAILGPGLINAMIAIGIVYAPQYARILRSSVLSIKENDYVTAARAMGASDLRIMLQHISLNAMAPIIVQATLTAGAAIIEAAGLGFLGLGAQPPTPEWGAMLSGGRDFMLSAPWIATFPGLAIAVTVLGFNLLGDALRDALDPTLHRH